MSALPVDRPTVSPIVERARAAFASDFRYLEAVLLAAHSRKGEKKDKKTQVG